QNRNEGGGNRILRVGIEGEKGAKKGRRGGFPQGASRVNSWDGSHPFFGILGCMSSSEATFPALFAELVYLLAHEPDAVDEQQKVLGAAVAAIADGDASLTTSQLNVDLLDEGQTTDGVRLHELVTQMSAHSAH